MVECPFCLRGNHPLKIRICSGRTPTCPDCYFAGCPQSEAPQVLKNLGADDTEDTDVGQDLEMIQIQSVQSDLGVSIVVCVMKLDSELAFAKQYDLVCNF